MTRDREQVVAGTAEPADASRMRAAAFVAVLLVACLAFVARPAGASYLMRIERVSARAAGGQASGRSLFPAMSLNGRHVVFQSDAPDVVAGDGNAVSDVFLRDTVSGQTACVSVTPSGTPASGPSGGGSVSADGRYVAFASGAPDVAAGDTNGTWDVFVRDTAAGTTTRISVATGGVEPDGDSVSPVISADGRYVAFVSSASSLVASDTNGVDDVFVRDRVAGTTTRVSVGDDEAQANGPSAAPSIDSSGARVAFSSVAGNLVPGDANGASDVFVRDLGSGTTARVSVGVGGAAANLGSWAPSISGDGRKVAFESLATNLVPGDGNGVRDVFVRDRISLETTRASVATSGAEAGAESKAPAISADGGWVAFSSSADDLVAGDTNDVSDVFVRQLSAGGTTLRASASETRTQGAAASGDPALSSDGRYVAFDSEAANLVAADTNATADVFRVALTPRVFERIAGTTRFDTAIEASRKAYPGHADTVVVATGRNWPDALGGSALAGMVDGPVLLVEPASLPPQVGDELERLAPKKIYVLGSDLAVAANVEAELKALPGSPTVTRLGGAGRYATASLVASEVVSLHAGAWDGRVIVATGGDYPDALAVSPIASSRGVPVVLAHPDGTSPSLPPLTVSAVVLGNELAVSKRTYDGLTARLGASKVTRVGGAGRYATAVEIAGWGATLGLAWDGLAFSTGENFPDALSGGAMSGKLGSLMLLTRTASLPGETRAALAQHASAIAGVRVLGKPLAVSDEAVAAADKALGE